MVPPDVLIARFWPVAVAIVSTYRFDQATDVEPRLSVESVSDTIVLPAVIPPVAYNTPSASRSPSTYNSPDAVALVFVPAPVQIRASSPSTSKNDTGPVIP